MQFVTDADDDGVAFIERDTPNEERIEFADVNEETDTLIGVARPDPLAHDAGAPITFGEDVERELLVDGYTEAGGRHRDVPVAPELWNYFIEGTLPQGEEKEVDAEIEDDGEVVEIVSAPFVEPVEEATIEGAVEGFVGTTETRTNVDYGDLTTSGPTVWSVAPISGQFFVSVSCDIHHDADPGNSAFASYEIAHVIGDASNTQGEEGIVRAAHDDRAAKVATTHFVCSTRTSFIKGLTPGQWYRFRMKYRRNGTGAGTFRDRQIIVLPR